MESKTLKRLILIFGIGSLLWIIVSSVFYPDLFSQIVNFLGVFIAVIFTFAVLNTLLSLLWWWFNKWRNRHIETKAE